MKQVREAYGRQWQLEWLRPLGFNNTFAMMVRGDIARRTGIRTLSEAARAQAWKLGAGYEFKQRPDGLAGLLAAYSLRTDGDPVTMDLGLLYAALKSRRVDLIAANSTDGLAAVLDVRMLEDDRHYFPPYECAVVARRDSLARLPGLREAIEETFREAARRGDAEAQFRGGWRAPAAGSGGGAIFGFSGEIGLGLKKLKDEGQTTRDDRLSYVRGTAVALTCGLWSIPDIGTVSGACSAAGVDNRGEIMLHAVAIFGLGAIFYMISPGMRGRCS